MFAPHELIEKLVSPITQRSNDVSSLDWFGIFVPPGADQTTAVTLCLTSIAFQYCWPHTGDYDGCFDVSHNRCWQRISDGALL